MLFLSYFVGVLRDGVVDHFLFDLFFNPSYSIFLIIIGSTKISFSSWVFWILIWTDD